MSQHTTTAIHFAVQNVRFEATHYNDVPVITIGVDREAGVVPGLSNEVISIQLHGAPIRVVEEFIDPFINALQNLRSDLLVEAATVPHG